jgi:hypothetical protein
MAELTIGRMAGSLIIMNVIENMINLIQEITMEEIIMNKDKEGIIKGKFKI